MFILSRIIENKCNTILDLVFIIIELFLENINIVRLVLITKMFKLPYLLYTYPPRQKAKYATAYNYYNLIIFLGTQCKMTQKLLIRFSTYEFQNDFGLKYF